MIQCIFYMYSPSYLHLAQLGCIPGQGKKAECHSWMIYSVSRKRQILVLQGGKSHLMMEIKLNDAQIFLGVYVF